MERVEKIHFWFWAKRKFLAMVLQKYIRAKNLRVLDVGCGTGAIMEFVKRKGFVVFGIDVDQVALEYCRSKGLEVGSGLATKIGFPDDTFDIVLALDVLEHVQVDREAVQEIQRILKKGGIFIASVPAHRFLWSYHDRALQHWRRYKKSEIEVLISREKLNIKLITWAHAGIFLPLVIGRWLKNIFNFGNNESDVKEISPIINILWKVGYIPELIIFIVYGRLPFGTSLLVVAVKL